MEPWERAVQAVDDRAGRARREAGRRLIQALGSQRAARVTELASEWMRFGRLTVNFHPDRIAAGGDTVATGLARDGRYHSQWRTWISSGERSAVRGGEREGWEHTLFGGAYAGANPADDHLPVYGAWDLLGGPHGGSPRFGSSYLVLAPRVADRVTLCVGDSHVGPTDLGTSTEMRSILAGLAEQAVRGRLLDRHLGIDDLMQVLEDDGVAPGRGAARVLDGYVEAQVHGGIELANDVESIIVDPSFRGTRVEADLAAAARSAGIGLSRHRGSVLAVDDTPSDFRGPTMPALARRVAGGGSNVDAELIGRAAASIPASPPRAGGDPADSQAQQLKYLWHTVLAHGSDAEPEPG